MEEKLKKIIISFLNEKVDLVDLNDSTNLIDDLGFDSYTFISLIIEIEEQFKIEFDDDMYDLEQLIIFKNINEYVTAKVSSQQNGKDR